MLIKGPGLRAGETVSIPTSMTDVAPTLLELCGKNDASSPLVAEMDGSSFAPQLLAGDGGGQQAWTKDTVLIEYQSIHLKNAASTPPSCATYYHDGPNNTYSAIRVIADHEDLLYSEFADVTDPLAWNFAPGKINFFELYNVSEDYFMLTNIYDRAPVGLQRDLHAQLHRAISCKGNHACTAALKRSGHGELEVVI